VGPKRLATSSPRAGRQRSVPVPAALRDVLLEHKLASYGSGLVFPNRDGRPTDSATTNARARRAWGWRRGTDGGWEPNGLVEQPLDPIGLHECRHPFASLIIAAGVNAKALSTYLGHSSVTTTFDRYGHLMPGNEEQAAGLLDAYLARADSTARLAALAPDAQAGH
jgi:integrase